MNHPMPEFSLRSADTDYHVFVEAPGPEEPGPWPAVLFMDGDDQFRFAVEAYRRKRATGLVPALLLVGVGYGASYTKAGNRRMRDYTPTAMAGEPGTGGGDAFLEFLATSLWPELEKRYAVDPAVRGIAGHSLGSLLALHALFQPLPFFNRFLISSPSVWYDDRSILRLGARLREGTDRPSGRAFLSIGDEDTRSMTGDFDLLQRQLLSHPVAELDVTVRHFPGLDHYNVLPEAFAEGLERLFGQ